MHAQHPRRKEKEIVDGNEINRILKAGKYIVIALAHENIPYIVTLSYGFDAAQNYLYFHAANTGAKLDFIQHNAAACGTIIEDRGYLTGQCDHNYASLVIRGQIRQVETLDEKKHGLNVLLNHLEPNPKPILERNIQDDSSYQKVTILRFEIESISGKEYKG